MSSDNQPAPQPARDVWGETFAQMGAPVPHTPACDGEVIYALYTDPKTGELKDALPLEKPQPARDVAGLEISE